MIPYYDIPEIVLWGGLRIHFFGFTVYLALMSGYLTARWRAGKVGQNVAHVGRMVVASALGGLVVSHWFAIAFYHPELLAQHGPWYLLMFWTSLSSFGGFVGGMLTAVFYLRLHKLAFWDYFDTLVVGFTTGWLFGRLGCAVVHDHPGIASNFFLAVKFPDGPRHDLGLYEFLFTIVLNIMVWRRAFKKETPGTIVALVVLCYVPVRFLLDFLRVSDRRWLGLTPGQYASVLFGILGLWIAKSVRERGREAGLNTAP